MTRTANTRNIKVFISYRNIELSKQVGETIANELQRAYGYEVFIDTQKLRDQGGEVWEQAIYENARSSDVLMVLLEPATSESNWVQREVDVARGAHVSLLPVVIVPERSIKKHIPRLQADLAISSLQYLLFNPGKPDYGPIRRSIEKLAKETRNHQQLWAEALAQQREARPVEVNDPAYAVYRLKKAPDLLQVCLAAGDMTRMRGIDVLVNSENNYMQMARIYESAALSSALRREGSWLKDGRILDDTVQKELDQQIAKSVFRSRPIEIEQVIVTHAGHPKSQLVRNGARCIFHAATVYVHPRQRTIIPIRTDESVRNAVLNCLNRFVEVDQNRGVFSAKGSRRRKQEESEAATYDQRPLRSIVFPLFGTGRGGRSAAEVAVPMLKAFRDFALENAEFCRARPDLSIHLAVYLQTELEVVEDVLASMSGDFLPAKH